MKFARHRFLLAAASVAILLPAAALAADLKILARVAIGVAVKAGTPAPDVSTVDKFKQALLQASKLAYIDPAAGGSSGVYLDGLFERMGIAQALGVVRAKGMLPVR